jgi:hypothetical protein
MNAIDIGSLKLGKAPAKSDARTPPVMALINQAKIQVPMEKDRSTKIADTKWGMLGNDDYGDCDWAGYAHALMLMGAVENKPWHTSTSTVVAAYLQYSNQQDTGTVMLDALNLRRKYQWANFGAPMLEAYAGISLGSGTAKSIAASTYVCSCALLGIALPEVLQRTPYNWDVQPPARLINEWAPGSWGGHAVPNISYNLLTGKFKVISWDHEVPVSQRFLECYTDEGYAPLHPFWRNRKGSSPNGFTAKQIRDYMRMAA